MRIIKIHVLFISGLLFFLVSCRKLMPAGFWNDFHTDLIISQKNDQGPWGGEREIHWKSNGKNKFTEKEIIDFAAKNDWILKQTVSLKTDTLKPTSLEHLKLDEYSIYLLKEKVISKLAPKEYKILIFKTTTVSIEPGNLDETYQNGFVALNQNGTELKIFHFWGE